MKLKLYLFLIIRILEYLDLNKRYDNQKLLTYREEYCTISKYFLKNIPNQGFPSWRLALPSNIDFLTKFLVKNKNSKLSNLIIKKDINNNEKSTVSYTLYISELNISSNFILSGICELNNINNQEISLRKGTNITLKNLNFINCPYINIKCTQTLLFENCEFTNSMISLDCDNITFKNCKITSESECYYDIIDCFKYSHYNDIIFNNVIFKNYENKTKKYKNTSISTLKKEMKKKFYNDLNHIRCVGILLFMLWIFIFIIEIIRSL